MDASDLRESLTFPSADSLGKDQGIDRHRIMLVHRDHRIQYRRAGMMMKIGVAYASRTLRAPQA